MKAGDDGVHLAVVVVNYGTSHLLATNLRELSDRSATTVVVVDNFTTTAERGRVRSLSALWGWCLVEPDANIGFGAGVNAGVERACSVGADLLLILNPDASIDEESVARLVQEVQTHPRSIVAPRIMRPNGAVWSEGMQMSLYDGEMLALSDTAAGPSLPWLTGACLLMSLSLWSELGGFDERYFLYWEDVELSFRALERGVTLRVVQAATAVHAVGGSQSAPTRAKSPTYYYFNVRNRLLFAAQHLDAEAASRWVATGRRADRAILLRGGRRQLLTSVRPLLAVLRGRRDGRALVAETAAANRPGRRRVTPAERGASDV